MRFPFDGQKAKMCTYPLHVCAYSLSRFPVVPIFPLSRSFFFFFWGGGGPELKEQKMECTLFDILNNHVLMCEMVEGPPSPEY